MRIQKYLSMKGVASRRSVEKAIQEGRIFVNGKLAILGQEVEADDCLRIDKQHLTVAKSDFNQQPLSMIKYHKPLGQICSKQDDKNRPVVFDFLPKSENWFMVGRLDVNTSGLLLFVNQGDAANVLMHPSAQLARVYEVKVSKSLNSDEIRQLTSGITLEDGKASFSQLKPITGRSKWYSVSLYEGRNRIVRRLFQSLDVQIVKLRRVAFGGVKLDRGQHQKTSVLLTKKERAWLESLLKNTENPKK